MFLLRSVFLARSCRFVGLTLIVGMGIVAHPHHRVTAAEGEAPAVAVLNLDRSAEGAMLERLLRKDETWRWWPRGKQQELVQAIALSLRLDLPIAESDEPVPAGLPLLVIVTTATREEQKLLQIAVCDCRQGVRLATHRVTLLPKMAFDVEGVGAGVLQSLQKHADVREVWAVPPLVSRDLGHEHDGLITQYAHTMEEVLLARPGAVAVELEHAGAIDAARRSIGEVRPIERPCASYIVGEYRNDGKGDGRRLTIGLKLFRGAAEELDRNQTELSPLAADDAIREFAGAAAKRLNGAPLLTDDPETEPTHLSTRWNLYQQNGDAEAAVQVAEARLLLQPNEAQARCHLIVALGRCTSRRRMLADQFSKPIIEVQAKETGTITFSRPNPRAAEAMQNGLAALNSFRRGLTHVQVLLTGDEAGRRLLIGDSTSNFHQFTGSLGVPLELPVDPERQLTNLARQLNRELRNELVAMYYETARLGQPAYPRFLDNLSGEDCLNESLRVIVETQDFPKAEQSARMLAERAVVQCGPLADAVRFLDQLAASSNPALQTAAAAARKNYEAIAASRRIDQPRSPVEPPAEEPAGPVDVDFNEVKLPWSSKLGISQDFGKCQLFLMAGKADLFVGYGQVLLMKNKGEAKVLWEDEFNWMPPRPMGIRAWGCFDGRFAWVPLSHPERPQRLLVVDIEEEKVVEWTREDGLPLAVNDSGMFVQPASLAIAPLAPGKVCIAGSSGRGWLAIAEYDPATGKSAKVIFEAREEPDPNNPRETQKRNLAFEPLYIFTLAGRIGEDDPLSQRVLVGRMTRHGNASNYPLLVDPATGEVEIVQSALKPFILPYATARDDSLYWATTDYVYDMAARAQKRTTQVFRLGYPDFQQRLVVDHGEIGGQQRISLGFEGEKMLCLGNPLFMAEAPKEPWRKLLGKLPTVRNSSPDAWQLAPSTHYDWVAYSPQHGRVFAVTLNKGEAKPSAEAVPE